MPSKDSKRNFALLRDKILAQNGKDYWRSVEEFVDAPEFEEFVKREYPAHAEQWDNSLSRRNFIKVMGASLALAGLSGCVVQPPEKIVPYVTQPENFIPGKPLFYATAMALGGVAVGLLAESYDGRPIKVEGNPEHPGSLGATDSFAQASILGMYDPDRSQQILFRGNINNWQNFMREARARIDENRADGGTGVRFLTETVTSPTMIGQFRQLASELPNSKWIQYEPVNDDNAMAGAKMAFGSPVNTIYKFDQADRILSLDADIFSKFNVRYTKDYVKRRNFAQNQNNLNRLYVVESTLTITGAKADHRLAVKPSQIAEIAKAVAAAVGVGGASPSGLSAETIQWVNVMAKDLQAHRGKTIVVPGDHQSPEVHALVHAINGALGNVGQTVIYTEPLRPFADKLQIEQLRELIADIDAGRVKMLVVLGGNPVYNTPADLKLDQARMEKIPLRIHLGDYFDETAAYCHWHIPQKHFLEMWGDARAYDGTVSIMQPLIKPLYGGKSASEVLQIFFRENYDMNDLDIVKQFWQSQGLTGGATVKVPPPVVPATSGAGNQQAQTTAAPSPSPAATPASPANQTAVTTAPTNQTQPAPASTPANFEDNWRKVVHDGFIPNSALPTKAVSANTGFLSQPAAPSPAPSGKLEVSILPDSTVYDGRFANNGWLQELPKPLTKITWENVALISPRTAANYGLNQADEGDYNDYSGGEMGMPFINTKGGNQFSDLVRLRANGLEIPEDVPVWIAPGQPDDVVTIFLGYGRGRAGRVGTGLGYNAYSVRRSDALYFGTGDITKTGAQTTVASTQIHFNLEGRDLLLVWDVENVEAQSKARHKKEEKMSGYDKSMYPRFMYNSYKWGMTIDLNNCVGCNACVVACQAENNIPVVGKEQVERSREMHWLRVDTYFTGTDINNPEGTHFQPILCQQCELAPCEVVCPVHATVHSAEGLNDMVYNRCVGTRYCSNNCPYKVRRFNFLLYQDWYTPQYKLMRNPEVSVRSRGVMEKCTFCTQRISAARIEAEKEGRHIRDGEILTACQAACPADAIVFGDLNDETAQVTQLKKDPRNYTLLYELNTQPRTTYLAGIKNQNKEMPGYKPLKAKGHGGESESH